MKKVIIFLLILIPIIGITQTELIINGFSDKYVGKIQIDKGYENDVFKKGTISIHDISSNELLIKIESEELIYDLDEEGQVKTNVRELPYGEQSIITSQDFDFDGINDLAIMDGQFSCYHGPSYQIYLQKENSLIHSPEFTKLAQEYCGLFNVDYETKTIHTMTKSGCCWHQFSDFIVVNNIPVETNVYEEGISPNGIMLDIMESNTINGITEENSFSVLLLDEIQESILFSFSFNNGKTVRLIESGGSNLYYVFTDTVDVVELFYADEFIYSSKKQTLTFTNQNTIYQVSSNGISVITSSKKVNMKAKSNSVTGAITSILKTDFENVKVK